MRELADFTRKLQKLERAYSTLPTKMGAVAVRFSKERFYMQNWADHTREPWSKRKVERGSKRRRSRKVLVDSGRLKRSIRVLYKSHNYIVIGTDVPYARIHNEGGQINKKVGVKSHTRKAHVKKVRGRRTEVKAHKVKSHTKQMNVEVEKRQFIGESAILTRRIERLALREIENALNTI